MNKQANHTQEMWDLRCGTTVESQWIPHKYYFPNDTLSLLTNNNNKNMCIQTDVALRRWSPEAAAIAWSTSGYNICADPEYLTWGRGRSRSGYSLTYICFSHTHHPFTQESSRPSIHRKKLNIGNMNGLLQTWDFILCRMVMGSWAVCGQEWWDGFLCPMYASGSNCNI